MLVSITTSDLLEKYGAEDAVRLIAEALGEIGYEGAASPLNRALQANSPPSFRLTPKRFSARSANTFLPRSRNTEHN